ncbi:hypothetical protein ACFY00_18210 [Kitasatospora sp. NPDC001540]|uniref:hypothetical protein n=1 Tax=Kitasatospora sp. NPDC001540 TaxID=3364014 RepID=UPI0036B3A43E
METWGELADAARADGIGQVTADAVVTVGEDGLLLLQRADDGTWVLPGTTPTGADGAAVDADLRTQVLATTGLALGPITGPHASYDTRSADGDPAAVVRHYLYRAAAPQREARVRQADGRLVLDHGLRLDRVRYRYGNFTAWPSRSHLVADAGLESALDTVFRTAESRAARAGLFAPLSGAGAAEVVAGGIDYGHFTLQFAPSAEAVVPRRDRITPSGDGAIVAVPTAVYSQPEAVFRLALCAGPQHGPGASWVPLGEVTVDLTDTLAVVLVSTVHGALLDVPLGRDAVGRHTVAVWRRPRGTGPMELFDIRLWPSPPAPAR